MSIQVQNISKRFGDFVALDNISLDFPSGELVALLGPTGCGKTTLLRIIAGLEQADAGAVILDGETPGPFELVLILDGSWRLDANLMVRESVTGTSRPADGSEPAGPRPLMESVLAAFSKQAETVPTELLRVTADELVMREVEAGVATLGCQRDAG